MAVPLPLTQFTSAEYWAMVEAGIIREDERVELLEGIGRFGWAVDPEGNRFELWEPSTS